jgi:hypothetical protein
MKDTKSTKFESFQKPFVYFVLFVVKRSRFYK